MHSIKRDLFINVVILSVVVVLIFGSISMIILYFSGMSSARETIRHKNRAATYFIEGYFKKFYTTIDFLSHLRDVRLAPYLDEKSRQNVLEIYGLIEKADSDINYIYSGYRNGMLLINNYEPPEGFDPTIRPWYTAAIESYPEISWGEPYQEIKTKEWLVSVSKALVDEENNITEVLAIDTSLEKLENILWDSDERYRSSYSYVIKEDQQIIIHHDKQHLRHNLSDVVKKSLSFEKNYGSFEYRLNNTEKIAYYSRIENLGWIVITVVNKDEITKPIFSQMGTTILLFIIASSILGWFMSNSFSKKIVIPLLMLKERVNRVIEGKLNGQSISEFPDNEIGTIADDIFRLTGKELYKKNQELKAINEELERISITDKLNGLFNRYKMDEEMRKAFYLWKRYQRPFSLIMIDIDWFKKVNDTYGHQIGDKVLQELGALLKKSLRASDIVSRWGGEEFLVLSLESDEKGAITLAEKIRSEIENYSFAENIKITVSIGVCSAKNHETIDELLVSVDEKMYIAKQSGRNRVVGCE